MITVYDIAKYCGVSPSTVSKVMNNYSSIPLETKNKILKAMKELDYVPNAGARTLSKGKSFNVGVLTYFGTNISPFKHSLFSDILDSFQSEMNKKNYDLLFISKNVRGKDASFLKNCLSRRVDGVLLFGDIKNNELQEVLNSDIPSISFDYLGNNSSSVSSNNAEMTIKLVDYLVSLGHKKIAFVGGDTENDVSNIRFEAYKKALSKNKIKVDDNLIIVSRYYETDNIEKTIKSLLELKDKPTAIMFPDDYTAIAAIKILSKFGLSCPDDISITGFDGINVGQMISPSLTTIKQDVKKIGQELAKELLKMLTNNTLEKKHIIVEGQLIEGESVKKIN